WFISFAAHYAIKGAAPNRDKTTPCTARSVMDYRHELHEQRHQGACFWHVMQGINIDPTPKIGAGSFT
ncbi:MAG: hypothetical protein O2994_08995, partial [Proteobacteria bacterium]|nr:hypothetical protein [Pseudomonadota bacterium]